MRSDPIDRVFLVHSATRSKRCYRRLGGNFAHRISASIAEGHPCERLLQSLPLGGVPSLRQFPTLPARAPGSWRRPSRSWLVGTTSSLACTAVVAPASANRFQAADGAGNPDRREDGRGAQS